MKRFINLVIASSVLVLVSAGCSSDSTTSGGTGQVTIPQFSKGISDSDEAEFLSVVDQVSVFLGKTQLNTNYFHLALRDMEAYGVNNRAEVLGRSDLTSYRQMADSSMYNCQFRTRSENDPAGRVSAVSMWVAGAGCATSLSVLSKSSSSHLGQMDQIQVDEQGMEATWNRGLPFRGKDIVSLSVGVKSDRFQRQSRPNDYKYGAKASTGYKALFTVTMANGATSQLEVGLTSNTNTVKLDNQTSKTTGSAVLTLVYRGTVNPIVYQKTETFDGLRQVTVITINGEEVFRNPKN